MVGKKWFRRSTETAANAIAQRAREALLIDKAEETLATLSEQHLALKRTLNELSKILEETRRKLP